MGAYQYYPMNYPYGAYYPQAYQPVQPQQPQQTQPVTQNSIIWVSGESEAMMFPVAPNAAVALWEQSGKSIYLKSADATGKPTLKIYDLVERTETASTASQAQDAKMDYATKEELSAVAVAIKGALGDIEQMKSDLYGMAGRKKIAKKAGENDDDDA